MQTSDNPFKLRYVTEIRTPGKLDDTGPCVVLATPSMLQSGLSRELFDTWCEDSRNGIIICDFAVQGTLAREIQGTPSHVITRAGAKVSLQSGCVCCCHLCNAGQNELATYHRGQINSSAIPRCLCTPKALVCSRHASEVAAEAIHVDSCLCNSLKYTEESSAPTLPPHLLCDLPCFVCAHP